MRCEKGLSQKELGNKIGYNQNTISGYESRARMVSSDILESITDALDYEIHFIKKQDGKLQKCIIKSFF